MNALACHPAGCSFSLFGRSSGCLTQHWSSVCPRFPQHVHTGTTLLLSPRRFPRSFRSGQSLARCPIWWHILHRRVSTCPSAVPTVVAAPCASAIMAAAPKALTFFRSCRAACRLLLRPPIWASPSYLSLFRHHDWLLALFLLPFPDHFSKFSVVDSCLICFLGIRHHMVLQLRC